MRTEAPRVQQLPLHPMRTGQASCRWLETPICGEPRHTTTSPNRCRPPHHVALRQERVRVLQRQALQRLLRLAPARVRTHARPLSQGLPHRFAGEAALLHHQAKPRATPLAHLCPRQKSFSTDAHSVAIWKKEESILAFAAAARAHCRQRPPRYTTRKAMEASCLGLGPTVWGWGRGCRITSFWGVTEGLLMPLHYIQAGGQGWPPVPVNVAHKPQQQCAFLPAGTRQHPPLEQRGRPPRRCGEQHLPQQGAKRLGGRSVCAKSCGS